VNSKEIEGRLWDFNEEFHSYRDWWLNIFPRTDRWVGNGSTRVAEEITILASQTIYQEGR